MATKEQVDKLSAVLDELAIVKRRLLSSHLERMRPAIVLVRRELVSVLPLIDNLRSLPTQHLPDLVITQISDSFERLLLCYHKYKKYFIRSSRIPMQRSDQLLSEIRACANDISRKTEMWIPFLAYMTGDVAENSRRLSDAADRAENLVSESETIIQRKVKQIEQIIIQIKESAANAGAGVFTDAFLEESERNRRNAFWWLGATFVFAGAAFGFSIWAYNVDYSKYTTPLSLWPKLASKIVLLSMCLTASMWCGKIFKSAKHLSLLNRHRWLGLKTFQAFSSSASDSHTKDMVLLETTRSIFANPGTGLINVNNSGEIDPNIIQIAGKALDQSHGT